MSSTAMRPPSSTMSDFAFHNLDKPHAEHSMRESKHYDHCEDGRVSLDAASTRHNLGRHGDPPSAKLELQRLVTLALPIILICVLEMFPVVISIMLVGRIDSPHTTAYVAGATLSAMVLALTGEAITIGLATALDTLFSQAHGAGQPQKIGISFQTGLLVLGVVYIPVFFVNWFTEDLLRLFHQSDHVAALAGRFSRLILPGLPFVVVYELLRQVLQAQHIVAPMVGIAVLGNAVNLGLGVYLTWHTSLGFEGVAIARTVANMVLPLATIPYFVWKPEHFYVWWPGWQPRAALQHVRVFLSLGIPGLVMVVLEYLSYDIVAILVAYLANSTVATSVHSVLWNVTNICFRLYLGVAIATNVNVGNYVGSGQHAHAKMVANVGLAVSFVLAVTVVTTIAAVRTELPKMFVSDHEAIRLAASALLYLIPFGVLDAVNCVMQGIFRGTGRQTFAAIVNLLSLFVIGLPCRFLFGFTLDLGVNGFWLGLTVGYVCCVTVSLLVIWRTDWQAITVHAKQRLDG